MNKDDHIYQAMQAFDIDLTTINITANEAIKNNLLTEFYSEATIQSALTATLAYINQLTKDGLELPYFADINLQTWQTKAKALDIYITNAIEGREINREARGKDYATNILSYPSEMPASVIELMPTIALGELIICHEVLVLEADEQNKSLAQHSSHLLVHGILHLLGFDHELGQAEQKQMEHFEIDILKKLGIPNPYL